jgi:ATP-binding cassette subfamily B protein/subfamily B ATP-binding cassette protein MsbA
MPFIRPQWGKLLLILALTAATSFTVALQPLPLMLLVDHALGSNPPPPWLGAALEQFGLAASPTVLFLVAASCSIAIFVLNSALGAGLSLAWPYAGLGMVYALAGALYHRLQRLSLLFHRRHPVGDSLSRLSEDAWCVYTLASELLIAPVDQVLRLATVGAVAWHLDPQLAGLSLVAAPLLAVSTRYFGRKLKRQARLGREAQSRLMSFVHQTLTTIPIVQVFSTEAYNRQHFQRLATDAVAISQRRALVTSSYGMVNGFVVTAGAALVLFVGGHRVLSGTLSLGTLLVFVSYMRTMHTAAGGLLKIYGAFKPLEASIDRVMDVLDTAVEVEDRPGAKPLPSHPTVVRGHIRLEAVTFGYEPGRPVLEDITLEARAGETIALVGPTGAGKSTLLSLLLRFFDPWKGRVTFDGLDLREVQLSSLRSQVAIVPQEPFLLPLSVAENIAYGHPEASQEEIVAAAVAANADKFILGLPQGYQTVIGERGATLSTGERQRLAIARALLKDAPVLILDEPTAALDVRTEKSLLEALERLMAGRTTFIVAHRLSTIRQADRIVVLAHGRVAEVGTHEELLAAGGAYQHMHSLQFRDPRQEVVA